MKITKLKSGNYQRNGISGEGFFSVLADWSEDGVKYKNFLITFRTLQNSSDTPIDLGTCRVVDLEHPKMSWRGDNFAYELQHYFNTHQIKDIYEYLEKLK